tara:strand:- start:609 stop:1505 length:897 start_codon:yes stop_codon:yes gene_type:complete
MKKILYLILVGFFTFSACKDDETGSPEPNDPLAVGEVSEDNTAMFNVYGATYCWNCYEPTGTYMQRVMDLAGDEMISFKMAGNYSYASLGVTKEATELVNNSRAEHEGIRGFAAYTLNNRDWGYLANADGAIAFADAANAAIDFGTSSDVKANVASKFSLDGKNFKLKYKFKAFEDLTSTHSVAFYVIANDMEAWYWPGQSGAPLEMGIWKPFLLGSLNGTFGAQEISDLKSGETFEGEVEFNAENLEFDMTTVRPGESNIEITEDLLSRADIFAVIWNNQNISSNTFVNCSKSEKVQ